MTRTLAQVDARLTAEILARSEADKLLRADLTGALARITALEAPAPSPDPVGWKLVFSDDFTTWDPTRYFVYPTTWLDTSKLGYRNAPGQITSDGTKLRCHIGTFSDKPSGAHFIPLVSGAVSAYGDLPSMRVEFRMRADLLPGYKAAPLLWPMSGNWPTDGEIDYPEGDFGTASPAAFMHRQGATTGSDQDYYGTPAGTRFGDWHTYVIEWRGGVSCAFFLDGVNIGKSTSRVPNTPMHFVMQIETNLSGSPIDPATAGYVEIEYLKVWAAA